MNNPNLEARIRSSSLQNKDMSVKIGNQKKFGLLKWAIFHGQTEMIDSLLEEETPVDNPVHFRGDFRPPLHSSVYFGDPDIVRRLLLRGASVNAYDRNHETALTLATKFEKYALVDLILSDKRLKNFANKENFTHLHIACMRNRVDVVEKLVEYEINVNIPVDSKSIRWPGYTPLHFAVQYQCIETVAFLLSIGADITIPNSSRLTALHLADMIRNDQIIDMLLANHRKIAQNPMNSEGLSHFHIACTRNNTEIVDCFLKNGVNLGESVHESSLNWSKYTAIDFAMHYDCVDVVKLLLIKGGRKMFPIRGERTDLLTNAYCSGNVELVNLILRRDELKYDEIANIQKLPSLHYSCIRNDFESVKKSLMKAPNEVNTSSWQGSTPLHLVIERRNEEIVKYLLGHGANPHIKNAEGKTALHIAFERGLESILWEISRTIKENHADNDGFSYFHISCILNDEEVVERIMEVGTDVNAPVNFDSKFCPGFTPLHFAAKFGSAQVAQILLEHGASYTTTDRYNLSPFDVAMFEFQYIHQAHDSIGVMREILLSHHKRKMNSFNDRGFSLLHVVYPGLDYDWDAPENDYRRDLKNYIRENPSDLNKVVHRLNTPWDGYTPLHFALLDNNPDHVNSLVEMGANVYIQAADGNTPMHLSSHHFVMPDTPQNTSTFDELIHNPLGKAGESLFHVACSAVKKDWVEYFLNNGVDPNSRNTVQGLEFLDRNPLHLAMRFSSNPKLPAVRLLLESGTDAAVRDHLLNTPLHYMASDVETEVIDLLIKHGVDVNSRNAFLETPLLSICVKKFFDGTNLSERVVTLLDHGADINLADEKDVIPLTADTWNDINELNRNLSVIRTLLNQVMKLKTLGLYVSDKNQEVYSNLYARATDIFRSQLDEFMFNCDIELELMKRVSTDKYTTLYDILLKDLNSLAVMSENAKFQQIVNSDDLIEKYPIYGAMLKMQLKKGQERRPLVFDAEKALKTLVNITIPRECLQRILQFLANEDLKNIIMSNNQP